MDGLQQILTFSYFHFWGSLFIGLVVFFMVAGKEALFWGLMAEGEIFDEAVESKNKNRRKIRMICGIIAGIFVMANLSQGDYFEMQMQKNEYSGIGITKTISFIMDVEKDMKEQEIINIPEDDYRFRYVHPEYQYDEDTNIRDYCIALYGKPFAQIARRDYDLLKNTTFNKTKHTLSIYKNSGFLADIDGMTVLEYPIDKEATAPSQREPFETEFQIETFSESSDHWAEFIPQDDITTYIDEIYPFSFQYPTEIQLNIYNEPFINHERLLAHSQNSDKLAIDVKYVYYDSGTLTDYFHSFDEEREKNHALHETGIIECENVKGRYSRADVETTEGLDVQMYLCMFHISETEYIQFQCMFQDRESWQTAWKILQSFTLTE